MMGSLSERSAHLLNWSGTSMSTSVCQAVAHAAAWGKYFLSYFKFRLCSTPMAISRHPLGSICSFLLEAVVCRMNLILSSILNSSQSHRKRKSWAWLVLLIVTILMMLMSTLAIAETIYSMLLQIYIVYFSPELILEDRFLKSRKIAVAVAFVYQMNAALIVSCFVYRAVRVIKSLK
jgi:hypothetical protein